MICHRKKCIFVDVPGTGSTSIKAALVEAIVPRLLRLKYKTPIMGFVYLSPMIKIP